MQEKEQAEQAKASLHHQRRFKGVMDPLTSALGHPPPPALPPLLPHLRQSRHAAGGSGILPQALRLHSGASGSTALLQLLLLLLLLLAAAAASECARGVSSQLRGRGGPPQQDPRPL